MASEEYLKAEVEAARNGQEAVQKLLEAKTKELQAAKELAAVALALAEAAWKCVDETDTMVSFVFVLMFLGIVGAFVLGAWIF